MEPTTTSEIARLEQKIDAIYVSVEKTRKYILWTVIATVVAFVLPLIGIAFVAPSFIGTYTTQLNQVQGLTQ